MIETIEWTDDGVVMIDHRLLPTEEIYNTYQTVEEVAEAIVTMVIRGAPAIGVAAAMGIALGVKNLDSRDDLEDRFAAIVQPIHDTRPTARNLFWAIERMNKIFESHKEESLAKLQDALKDEAIQIHDDDIEINRQIGQNGQVLLAQGSSTVLTHCNAGALATGGMGTALAVVYSAVETGKKIRVFADETRPLLQGARLTSWELMEAGVDVTVACDNAAASLMGAGQVQCVVVGADRIASNGDVANKIGTYGVAVLAREHDIPFYVAAPSSTFDPHTASGAGIPIEQRSNLEVTAGFGRKTVPPGVDVYNPAFDVTPARYVTGFITEQGLLEPPFKRNISGLFRTAATHG